MIPNSKAKSSDFYTHTTQSAHDPTTDYTAWKPLLFTASDNDHDSHYLLSRTEKDRKEKLDYPGTLH